jgi:hypothetical protein
MYCPQCKAEFRSGFTHCSDCDVDLVERLSERDCNSDEELPDRSLRGVWEGRDQDECVSICERLRSAEIPYKVIQHRRQYLKGLDTRFKISVPVKFCGKAKEIIQKGRLDFADEGEDQRLMELQSMGDVAPGHNLADNDRSDWRSAAATKEIWCEDAPKYSWMIEISLQANNIPARVEISADGTRKIFVSPNDESRAREIVHEIKDGVPPK